MSKPAAQPDPQSATLPTHACALPMLANREPGAAADGGRFALPADGKFHLVPLGAAATRDALRGRTVVQVVDAAAVDAMLNDARRRVSNGETEMLVDADHFSRDPEKETRARGWVQLGTLENRADGIWGEIKLTETGEREVRGGDYRYGSPEFAADTVEELGGNRVRPTALIGYAFTNRNNFRELRPLSNRGQTEPKDNNPPKPMANETNPFREALVALLGAPADESDSALLNRATQARELIQKGANYDALHADFEALRNRDADALIAAHGGHLEGDDEKAAAKRMILANRDDGLAMLKAGEKRAGRAAQLGGRQPLMNRGGAKPGEEVPNLPSRPEDRLALINRERSKIAKREGITNEQAYAALREERPELFEGAAESQFKAAS